MNGNDETKKTAPDEPLTDAETEDVSGGLGMPDFPEPAFIRPPLDVPNYDPPHFVPKFDKEISI